MYVDSGSQDDSVEATRARGIDVVELDRAFRSPQPAQEMRESIGYVSFVDGDCDIVDGWIEARRA
jgi:hypothetical protein